MKIKSLLLALVTATLLVTTACNDGKPYKIIDGTIHFKTPERPAGQQDVIALTAEPLETVRVGFIGLGPIDQICGMQDLQARKTGE